MQSAESPSPRYLVLLPSVTGPVGGVNILLWMIEVLNDAGYRAVVLRDSQWDAYDFRSFRGDALYSAQLDLVFRQGIFESKLKDRVWQALRDGLHGLLRRIRLDAPSRLAVWQPEPQDVLIVPEFMYPEALAVFGDRRCILMVQGYMVLLRSKLRYHGPKPEAFSAIVSTSEACAQAVNATFDTKGDALLLPVCHPGLTYNPHKRLQIAIMPRKRRDEAEILVSLIGKHPDLAGVPLVMIDQVSTEEAQRLIRESLIFLSLSEREGFGLPPAEAMATGSLVIGYTGVGGEEYFTPQTGFPIPDGDIVAFVNRVAEVVSAWRTAPMELDHKRLEASKFIWSRYDEKSARQSLLDLWAGIDAGLRAGG